MIAAFLILLATGALGAVAVPHPRTVTDALPRGVAMFIFPPLLIATVLALFFAPPLASSLLRTIQLSLVLLTLAGAFAAFALYLQRQQQFARLVILATAVTGVLAASNLLHSDMVRFGTAVLPAPKFLAMTVQTLVCVATAALLGLIPVTLLSVAQFWTKALARLVPALLVALSARLLLGLAAFPIWRQLSPVVPTGLLATRIALFALVLTLLLLALHKRRRGRSLLATRLLLTAFLLALAAEFTGLLLLRSTALPL